MVWLPCPHLGRDVELTAERERHIRLGHPELLPDRWLHLVATPADPDAAVRRDWQPEQVMLGRRGSEDEFHVVVVVSEDEPIDDVSAGRIWVLTAYTSPDFPAGLIAWVRDEPRV